MNNQIKILILTLVLGISSCSSSFILRTKRKRINLETLPENSVKVGVDNGIVLIKFNRNDLVNLFQNDLENWSDHRIKSYVDELKAFNSDTIFEKDRTVGTLPIAEYESKFHTLLLNGKADIENKSTKKYLKQIKYKFTRDKLGGKNAYFYDRNGTKIYEIVLALGE
ncbi:hypothetical protein [Gaetbulibacter aestuarii]|uniref:Beta-lactamase-inhibitor-like PepSY-like domain-containing protein n=1 Tax=Gaetbulibacter aestuarii TaxID=1502358 RepID=A0ABW7MV35_9FLAO